MPGEVAFVPGKIRSTLCSYPSESTFRPLIIGMTVQIIHRNFNTNFVKLKYLWSEEEYQIWALWWFCAWFYYVYILVDQPYLIEIWWSSGLRHQVSNQAILQVCGSIPSLAIFFFIKLIFHSIFFSLYWSWKIFFKLS